MFKSSVPAGAAIVLCLMVTGLAVGAHPTLESVTVTPAARSLSVGQGATPPRSRSDHAAARRLAARAGSRAAT